jgi:hypothetical protein
MLDNSLEILNNSLKILYIVLNIIKLCRTTRSVLEISKNSLKLYIRLRKIRFISNPRK